jgi:hypothetical protein
MVLRQEALWTEVVRAMPVVWTVVNCVLMDGYLGLFCSLVSVVLILYI